MKPTPPHDSDPSAARRASRVLRASLAAAGVALLAAAAQTARAEDEYAAASFSGGYVTPPSAPAAPAADPLLLIAKGQDDVTKEVILPFEFPFFGRLYASVSVCTNGWLAFGKSDSTESANAALRDKAAPNGIAAPLWDDLVTGTSGTVRTFTTGTRPNRVFVVAWTHVDTQSPASSDDLSFEVKLFEGTGVVELVYAAAGTWDGLSYTAGIEDPTGERGFGAGNPGNGNSGQPVFDWRFTPRAVGVSGTLLRDRPLATATGLGTATESGVPVVAIEVALFRKDNGEPAARTLTAADGTFTATLLGASEADLFTAEVLASGDECRVVDASGVVHRLKFQADVGAAAPSTILPFTLGVSVDSTNAAIRKAVNVQQAAQRGFAWARAAAADAVLGTATAAETFPRLDFTFVAATPAAGGHSGYTPFKRTAVTPATVPPTFTDTPAKAEVHDGADNPDPWDDDVILRLCGEHVLAAISVHQGAITSPAWDLASGTPAAWTDGFAHWFACVVQARATFIDTKTAASAVVLDLEAATPAPNKGPDVTGAVACSLWDLVDPANEVTDDFDGTLGLAGSTAFEVFKVVDLSLDALPKVTAPAVAAIDANSFFDVWRAQAPGTQADRVATARIWIRHGVFADDQNEPNDRAGEVTAIALTQKLAGLVLSKFNEDRYSFAFAPSGPAVLSVTVARPAAPTPATELDLQVLDASDVQVAFASNVGTPSQQAVTATTAVPVPAGTYKVRVVHRAGAASPYTLAFYETLRIVTAALPAWTVDRPNYKADLAAAGGVAPYTFVVTESVPGLGATSGGSRIEGTPEKTGDFDVTITVTDSSGSGTPASRDLTLTVHRRLRLATYFGLAANEDVDAEAGDVGSGGTGATWTPAPGEDGDGGVTVSGGATLRLVGNAGPPRTFDVAASAAPDATGAKIPADPADPKAPKPTTQTAHVVVCAPLPVKGSAAVPAGDLFGYWFDAVGGSRADLRFAFHGRGRRPELVAVVDETGLDGGTGVRGRVTSAGGTVVVSDLPLRRQGRWFAIFRQKAQTFTGRVTVGGRVAPPRDTHGIVVIDPAEEVVDVTFEAAAGSRLRISVLRAQVPRAMTPSAPSVDDPSGAGVTLPAPRILPHGEGRTVVFTAPAGKSGTYTLHLSGDGTRTGPIFWRVRATPPRRRAFKLF